MQVYVVSIPWDSYSVRDTYVFMTEKSAEAFIDKIKANENSNISANGLFVERCDVRP